MVTDIDPTNPSSTSTTTSTSKDIPIVPEKTPSGKEWTKLRENSAELLFENPDEVFYNPVQEFNRDLTISVIKSWSKIRSEEIRAKKSRKASSKKPESINPESNPNGEETSSSTATTTTTPTTEPITEEKEKDTIVPFTILDALSATGLRAIRYAKEIPGVKYIVANDLDAYAVQCIQRNAAHNGISLDKIRPNHGDAMDVLYSHRGANEINPLSDKNRQFDVVDLDPYGSASPFIDGAVQAVSDGGLLCVTCTDMASLAGGQIEACFLKYGSTFIPNTPYCHEMGLRILLHTISTAAAKYRRYIVPVMSCSIDFYIRIFVRVYSGAGLAKLAVNRSGMVYSCTGCYGFDCVPLAAPRELAKTREERKAKKQRFKEALKRGNNVEDEKDDKEKEEETRTESTELTTTPTEDPFLHMNKLRIIHHTHPDVYKLKFNPSTGPPVTSTCDQCSRIHHIGGPVWLYRLHHPEFISRLLTDLSTPDSESLFKTYRRIIGMATVISEELPDAPFYYSLPMSAKIIHTSIPALEPFANAIVNAGYNISLTHAKEACVKTDAPRQVVWDIFRKWFLKTKEIKPVESSTSTSSDQTPITLPANITPTSPAGSLLSVPILTKTHFAKPKNTANIPACLKSRKEKLLRFQPNPTANWGPKSRAKKRAADELGNVEKKVKVVEGNSEEIVLEDL